MSNIKVIPQSIFPTDLGVCSPDLAILSELSKSLALSDLSYRNNVSTPADCKYSQFFQDDRNKQDIQAYVFIGNDTKAYITFRGTQEIGDLAAVIDIAWQPLRFDSKTYTNKGCHDQYASIHDKLMSYLKLHSNEFNEVVFCGHSLGGGIAFIASIYFYHHQKDSIDFNPNKIIKVHTFAAPRPGGQQFNRHYQQMLGDVTVGVPDNHWRVVIDTDPIPMMPPQASRGCLKSVLGVKYSYMHVDCNVLQLGRIPGSATYLTQDSNASITKQHTSMEDHHTCEYIKRFDAVTKTVADNLSQRA